MNVSDVDEGWSKFEGFMIQGIGLLKVSHDSCAPMTFQQCSAEAVE
jgi:hypothetical protein